MIGIFSENSKKICLLPACSVNEVSAMPGFTYACLN